MQYLSASIPVKKDVPQSSKKSIPFPILDSIRGIAALYVALAHCRGALWIGGNEYLKLFPRDGWDWTNYLIVGSSMLTRLAVEFVIVFFVLSGFSIAHSLSNETSPLSFYKRRFIRIYPSYVVALFWAGLVFIITKAAFPQWYDGSLTTFSFIRTVEMNDYFNGERIVRNLLYMPGNGFITPFWSLTFEVIFYLLAPFLLKHARLYGILSVAFFSINLLFPEQVARLHLPIYLQQFLFKFNFYFFIGVFLYRNYSQIMQWIDHVPRKFFLATIFVILALLYGANFYFGGETPVNFLVAAIFGVSLILYFIKYEVRVPILMKAGSFSYTLYISHFATIYLYLALVWWIAAPTQPYILNYFVWMPAFFVCISVAVLQYWLVEKRTKVILSRLRKIKNTKVTSRKS